LSEKICDLSSVTFNDFGVIAGGGVVPPPEELPLEQETSMNAINEPVTKAGRFLILILWQFVLNTAINSTILDTKNNILLPLIRSTNLQFKV